MFSDFKLEGEVCYLNLHKNNFTYYELIRFNSVSFTIFSLLCRVNSIKFTTSYIIASKLVRSHKAY